MAAPTSVLALIIGINTAVSGGHGVGTRPAAAPSVSAPVPQ